MVGVKVTLNRKPFGFSSTSTPGVGVGGLVVVGICGGIEVGWVLVVETPPSRSRFLFLRAARDQTSPETQILQTPFSHSRSHFTTSSPSSPTPASPFNPTNTPSTLLITSSLIHPSERGTCKIPLKGLTHPSTPRIPQTPGPHPGLHPCQLHATPHLLVLLPWTKVVTAQLAAFPPPNFLISATTVETDDLRPSIVENHWMFDRSTGEE